MLLIDPLAPMSYTSAQSGDNYRNWWPHPTMTAFTSDSIDELDRLAAESGNVFNMTRGGYVLATRRHDVSELRARVAGSIDADIVSGPDVQSRFPALSPDIAHVLHIRRAGDISGQQLGQYLLGQARESGCTRLSGRVTGIAPGYRLSVQTDSGTMTVRADAVVNAAGPFAAHVARMLGKTLPIDNVYQQKIAFEDRAGTIPRDMPFAIDLDEKRLDWSDEERKLIADDPELAWLTHTVPGGTHCRPEGGAHGRWVKLGWACNRTASEPLEDLANEPAIDPHFPEIVMRGAAALIPALSYYVERPPERYSHYGGYYSMTEENWPLIGPLDDEGAFVAAAMSGFGSMAACAAGKLCAAHVLGQALPDYAEDLSPARLDNPELLSRLRRSDKGLL